MGMGNFVFAVFYFIIGVLQLLNIPTIFTKGFSNRIKNEVLRSRYLRICGVIKIALAAMFASMVWGEKLLSTHGFVVLYFFLVVLIIGWQILVNRKYLGSCR